MAQADSNREVTELSGPREDAASPSDIGMDEFGGRRCLAMPRA